MANSDQSRKNEVREYFSDASLPDYGVDARFFPSVGKRLVEFAGLKVGNKVLDVAAGRGASLFSAAELVGKKGEVIGIDLAEGMVEATRNEIETRGIVNASIILMDAEQLEFESETFDVVLCGFALFFFPDLERALHEFYRVLKPDGTLSTTTFGEGEFHLSWYEPLLEKYNLARDIPVTEALNHPETLQLALTKGGFDEVGISRESFDSIYQDEEDWWSHLWNTADRMPLESLREEELDSLKREAFDGIQALKGNNEIRVPYTVLFAKGRKIEKKI